MSGRHNWDGRQWKQGGVFAPRPLPGFFPRKFQEMGPAGERALEADQTQKPGLCLTSWVPLALPGLQLLLPPGEKPHLPWEDAGQEHRYSI